MKKTILAAAMLAGALSAQAAFVASDNIYGIINIPIAAGDMSAVGVSLLPMPGETNLAQNIILPAGLTAGDATNGDNLYVFNKVSNDYDTYFFANENGTNVWKNSKGIKPSVAPGDGVWIKRKSAEAATIYQVGLMPTNATIEVACDGVNSFIANPYPADLDFDGANSNIVWTGVVAAEKYRMKTADLIRIWNGVGYKTYFYKGIPLDTTNSGWYDADNQAVRAGDLTIPAGTGFWLIRRAGGFMDAPFSKPF